MGLDMYLYNAEPDEEEEAAEVCYWRKFNSLHKWFVDHTTTEFEDDNCTPLAIERADLEELIENLKVTLPLRVVYLQPTSGFFFGSTAVDGDYWSDVAMLSHELSEILVNNPVDVFYYQASY